MKHNKWFLFIIILIALGGYILAYIQYNNNIVIQKKFLKDEISKINMLDDELKIIRDDKQLTIDELLLSHERINKLLDSMMHDGVDSITLDEALKIINE